MVCRSTSTGCVTGYATAQQAVSYVISEESGMAESEISELANEDDPLLPLPVSMKSPVVNEGTPYNNQFDVMINEAGNYRPIGDRVADKATLTKSTVICVNDGCLTDVIHCHEREMPGNVDRIARRKLVVAILLIFVFMVVEIGGGILSGSLAVMTDAAHMLSDLVGYGISLCSMWLSGRQPTKTMSFGFHRAEIVGAVISIQIIWVMSGVLVYEAVKRVIYRDYHIDADIMLIVAGIGVAVNIIVGIVLRPPHGHGHSHGSTSRSRDYHHSHGHHGHHGHQHKPENLNVRAAFIHVLGDLVFSIGVLIAAYIIRYKPSWSLADPICTFIFSALVLITTFTVMRDALHVLMEGMPKQLSFDAIKKDLLGIYGVVAVHNMHIWSLTTDKPAMDVHLAISNNQQTSRQNSF
jgi:zinc transporter 2